MRLTNWLKNKQDFLYLATDHAGFDLKEELKKYIQEKYTRLKLKDFGAFEYQKDDDYPDFISLAARAVSYSKGKSRAVIFGGSGQGEAICANKFKYARAAVVNSENIELVRLAREHNNANILSFGARFVGLDFAKEAVDLFLTLEFDKSSRHARRIRKLLNKCC